MSEWSDADKLALLSGYLYTVGVVIVFFVATLTVVYFAKRKR